MRVCTDWTFRSSPALLSLEFATFESTDKQISAGSTHQSRSRSEQQPRTYLTQRVPYSTGVDDSKPSQQSSRLARVARHWCTVGKRFASSFPEDLVYCAKLNDGNRSGVRCFAALTVRSLICEHRHVSSSQPVCRKAKLSSS